MIESENASLKRALAEAEAIAARRKSIAENALPPAEYEAKIQALRAEIDAQDEVMEEIWSLLPSASARLASGLVEKDTEKLKASVASPSTEIDYEALRVLCKSPAPGSVDRFTGPKEMARRTRNILEDGQVLVERVTRAGKERELLKSNAARAQRLVEESQANLRTYQR